ncbi:MAG: bifunctional precorrin-2 dehydrogenase/sirohydrochlorin ferrochelatase [Desulfofustis sp.]|nr:bifunctional precorrin-2 dehydrogenase/sirohydrochlorin ferrochelatase [Desulfofustis sp.]
MNLNTKPADNPLYPVNLDIGGKRCLVVGGGSVAARKVKALLLCGGQVQIISPHALEMISRLAEEGRIEWLKRAYRAGDAKEAFLIFGATDDPKVQKQIAEDAARYHVLLNSAYEPELSDFHVPAKIRRRDLVIAVSTGGGSPALALLLKEQLANEYGEEYGVLVDLMAKIRRQVVTRNSVTKENKALFRAVLELPVLDCIKRQDWAGLEEQLKIVLPAEIDAGLLVEEVLEELKRGKNGN